MLIKNIRLLDREGSFDIRILDEKFKEIDSSLEALEGEEVIERGRNGSLYVPDICNACTT